MLQIPGIGRGEADVPMRLASNPLLGITVASLAAGPICTLLFLLGSTAYLIRDHAQSSELVYLWREYPILAWARGTLFGFIASMVPNTIGSWTLGLLGTVLPMARLWIFWPIAGGGLASLIPLALDGLSAPHGTYVYCAAGGAACAAICRCFTRWEPA
jgi:hypothetical protein